MLHKNLLCNNIDVLSISIDIKRVSRIDSFVYLTDTRTKISRHTNTNFAQIIQDDTIFSLDFLYDIVQ